MIRCREELTVSCDAEWFHGWSIFRRKVRFNLAQGLGISARLVEICTGRARYCGLVSHWTGAFWPGVFVRYVGLFRGLEIGRVSIYVAQIGYQGQEKVAYTNKHKESTQRPNYQTAAFCFGVVPNLKLASFSRHNYYYSFDLPHLPGRITHREAIS